jgi:hypothetical protein
VAKCFHPMHPIHLSPSVSTSISGEIRSITEHLKPLRWAPRRI